MPSQADLARAGIGEAPPLPVVIEGIEGLDNKYKFAALLAAGTPVKEVVETLGISLPTYYKWRALPEVVRAVAELREEAREEARSLIVNELAASARKIVRLRDVSQSEKIALEASKDLLDRGGLKAVDRQEQLVEHTFSPELLEIVQACIREVKIVQGSVVRETSILPERT